MLTRKFEVKLDEATYDFYYTISLMMNKPIEDILSRTLYKYADLLAQKATDSDEEERP